MKTAVAVWEGRISPVFDSACKALIICPGTNSYSVDLRNKDVFAKIVFLAEEGVEEILCGAVSNEGRLFAESKNIKIHGFIAGDIENVLQAHKENKLNNNAFAMPGCRRNCRGNSRGKGRCSKNK